MSLLSQAAEDGAQLADRAAVRESAVRQRILDGAYRQVLAVGVGRATLTDIAKAAGVSRMTVYRHYSGGEEILQDLMTREFNALIGTGVQAHGAAPEATRAGIVEAAVQSLEALSSHPLFMRILVADAELLLPYVTQRPGRFQQHAADLLAIGIAAAEDVRDDDPRRLAESMLLTMRGYALADKSAWSRARRRGVLADLARMLDALLAPESAA